LANWNKKDAKTVVADAMKNGIGLYGFVKPDSTSLLPAIENYLTMPVDSFSGDDRNIATLARIYNGLQLDFVKH
jgi:hypothetical protein